MAYDSFKGLKLTGRIGAKLFLNKLELLTLTVDIDFKLSFRNANSIIIKFVKQEGRCFEDLKTFAQLEVLVGIEFL
jgi:hypothetical protein